MPRSSLGGSEMSPVRSCLNRLIGIGDSDIQPGIEVDPNLDRAFDLGDETANAEEAMDRGETFGSDFGSKSPEEKLLEEQRHKTAQRKVTRSQIDDAVSAVNAQISGRKSR